MIKLIKENRKTSILKPPLFGCLKGIPSINITRGCLHSCVYCYARGFTDAPPKGEVHLYENLPEMLERELEKKRKLPRWVSFSTASDAFQDMDEVLRTTYSVMKIFLERDIGISFLTKGFIPSEFIELFKKYSDLIRARIGIVSLNEGYRRLFEPFSAHPLKRLLNIRNLINAGIDTSVRIDPIIPLIPLYELWPLEKGDVREWGEERASEDSIEHLIKRLKVAGIKNISVSALVMRSSIVKQFVSELPFKVAKDILRLYRDQPYKRVITSARTKLLPREIRIAEYNSINKIARRYGIDCHICGCKNPDLPWEFCNPWVDEESLSNTTNKQLSLLSIK